MCPNYRSYHIPTAAVSGTPCRMPLPFADPSSTEGKGMASPSCRLTLASHLSDAVLRSYHLYHHRRLHTLETAAFDHPSPTPSPAGATRNSPANGCTAISDLSLPQMLSPGIYHILVAPPPLPFPHSPPRVRQWCLYCSRLPSIQLLLQYTPVHKAAVSRRTKWRTRRDAKRRTSRVR